MEQRKHENPPRSDELTVWEHVAELRRTVIWSVICILIASSVVHYFRNKITAFILHPLKGTPLQFLSPLDPLVFILTIDFVGGVFVSSPIIVWLCYRFAAPALPKMGWKTLLALIIPITLAGAAACYAYYVAIPITLSVLTSITVPGIQVAFTAANYLSFFMTVLVMLILVFEMPVVMAILARLKLLRAAMLAKKRKYVYVGLLIAVAVITPTTDVVSLMLILLPTYTVFEVGLIGARMVGN